MAFASDDLLKLNQLLEQAMADPAARASLQVKLGVPPPQAASAEPREIVKALTDKVYRRCDKYTGVAGTWQEWSFNLISLTPPAELIRQLVLFSNALDSSARHS